MKLTTFLASHSNVVGRHHMAKGPNVDKASFRLTYHDATTFPSTLTQLTGCFASMVRKSSQSGNDQTRRHRSNEPDTIIWFVINFTIQRIRKVDRL